MSKLLKSYVHGALLLGLLLVCGSCRSQEVEPGTPSSFRRIFCWGRLNDEETARRFSEIGVTDICVRNTNQLDLARRYGMTPYGSFGPKGPHGQVMSPEEEAFFAYINGTDLKGLPAEERKVERHRRRLERRHRYGGEPDAPLDTINDDRIPCFSSDQNYELSRRALDAACERLPGVQGIYFDYLGYTNFKGCYCEGCLADYRRQLEVWGLPDTREQRDRFYLERLVDYYNAMVAHVKSRHPDFKVVAHLYPVFLGEPLYGNRTAVDYCGQTVAWYFPWKVEKIREYTAVTVRDAKRHFKHVEGIPFLGLNVHPGSLWVKDADTLERELRAILAAGGDTLMVCNGNDMLTPGIFEVFRKYAGNRPPAGNGD